MKSRLFKSATIKNAGWIIFGRIAQMAISLFVGLLTARYLGPSNYGLINYASAYVAFFMTLCTLGLNSILVKEFVDNPEKDGEIIGSALVMRGISSLISASIIICLVGFLEAREKDTIIVTSLCSIGLVFNIFETFNYWFQSKLMSKITTIVSLIAYIVTSIYKIILLSLGKNVSWFAFATSVDYICIGILLLFCYRKFGGRKLKFSWQTCQNMLGRSVHFILPGVMVAIYGYADKIMLKHMLNEVEVGYYSTATTLCSMWCFVLAAIIDSVNPSIMKAYKKDSFIFEKRNRQLYAIVFYISIGVSIAFCILANPIVRILYGEQYLPAANPLRVITWYTAFSYLGVARNAWIVSENKQKYLKYIYISSAICNVVLNFIFIPLWGTTGAALASLITQIATTLIVPFFIKEIRRNSILIVEGIFLKNIR